MHAVAKVLADISVNAAAGPVATVVSCSLQSVAPWSGPFGEEGGRANLAVRAVKEFPHTSRESVTKTLSLASVGTTVLQLASSGVSRVEACGRVAPMTRSAFVVTAVHPWHVSEHLPRVSRNAAGTDSGRNYSLTRGSVRCLACMV